VPAHAKLPRKPSERLRRSGYAARRAVWRLQYRPPTLSAPPHDPIVVVLGMHRSGTSAAVGILEDLGFAVPGTTPPDGTGENKRGTREPTELTRISKRVLEVNAASWHRPPATARLKYLARHVDERNRLIEQCKGRRFVLKDPRMLLMLDFWEDILTSPMAILRNPVDVAESLIRRRERVTREQCIGLWKIYNQALLRFVESSNCPIAVFDDPDFAGQVIRCVRQLGHEVGGTTGFFSEQAVRSRTEDWRDEVCDEDAVTLYDRLAALSIDRRQDHRPLGAASPL
jgi:hypothetical protein